MVTRRPDGNSLALIGVILYLLEFAVFIPLGVSFPAPAETDPVSFYAGRETPYALMAVLLSVLLLGRVAFIAGLRGGLRSAVSAAPLSDVALAAMTASVLLELTSLWLITGAAQLASAGPGGPGVAALDASAGWLTLGVFATLGVAVAVASLAMLQSRLFPAWLGWLGLISGIGLAGSAVAAIASGETPTSMGPVSGIGSFAWLGMVIWMLTTGIILLRRRRATPTDPPLDAAATRLVSSA